MYKPSLEQIEAVVQLGYYDELRAYELNAEHYDELSASEQADADEFARILFEMDDKENIWDFGVYC